MTLCVSCTEQMLLAWALPSMALLSCSLLTAAALTETRWAEASLSLTKGAAVLHRTHLPHLHHFFFFNSTMIFRCPWLTVVDIKGRDHFLCENWWQSKPLSFYEVVHVLVLSLHQKQTRGKVKITIQRLQSRGYDNVTTQTVTGQPYRNVYEYVKVYFYCFSLVFTWKSHPYLVDRQNATFWKWGHSPTCNLSLTWAKSILHFL